MRKENITKYRLNPKRLPKTDWRAFDAMRGEERHQAAIHDQDCPPATTAQLAKAHRVPAVRGLRNKLKLTDQELSACFHLALRTVRDWDEGTHRPDKVSQILLTDI